MPVDLELSGVPPPSLRAGASVTVSDGTVHLDDGTLVGALPADRVASLAGRTGRVRSVRRGDAPAVVVRFDEPAAVATAPARAAAPVVPPPRGEPRRELGGGGGIVFCFFASFRSPPLPLPRPPPSQA